MNSFALKLLVLLAAGVWALLLSHSGIVISRAFFTPLSYVVLFVSLVLAGFEKWFWRWPVVKWLAGRPDLSGCWHGTMRPEPSESNPAQRTETLEVFLMVRQSFSTLHVRLLSPESQSLSLAASIVKEADGQHHANWVYRSEPRHSVQDRSRVHLGAACLRVGEPEAMAGHYWTDRRTSGELECRLVTRKLAGDFASAQKLIALHGSERR